MLLMVDWHNKKKQIWLSIMSWDYVFLIVAGPRDIMHMSLSAVFLQEYKVESLENEMTSILWDEKLYLLPLRVP